MLHKTKKWNNFLSFALVIAHEIGSSSPMVSRLWHFARQPGEVVRYRNLIATDLVQSIIYAND